MGEYLQDTHDWSYFQCSRDGSYTLHDGSHMQYSHGRLYIQGSYDGSYMHVSHDGLHMQGSRDRSFMQGSHDGSYT